MGDRPYPSYYIYKDKAGFWRWRYDAKNGRTIFESSESYHNKADCEHGIALAKGSASVPIWEAAYS